MRPKHSALCLAVISMPKSFLYNSTDVTSVISKRKFMSKPRSVFWCKPRITTVKFMKLLTLALTVKPNSQWNNWHRVSEITTEIFYITITTAFQNSLCIYLCKYLWWQHMSIIPVTQIGNKDGAIFPKVKYAIRGRAESFRVPSLKPGTKTSKQALSLQCAFMKI